MAGVTTTIGFPTLVTYDVCGGSGGEPGTEPETCPECNVSGERRGEPGRSWARW